MKSGVIYARYSSDSQSEQSIQGQLRVCNEYAKSHDIVILKTYIDRAMTGTNDHRPDFQQMIKDSSRKEWDVILVYKLDRFSRNKYEMAMHKKTLKDNGVKVVSATEYIPDSPEAIILESVLEGYAEFYSAELSQKVKRGMRETRLKGLYQGGGLPYGYKVVDRKIIVDEAKAEVVRYMFEQYADGVYAKNIVASLTERGILDKGKPFVLNRVYEILKNEKYSGVYKHGEEIIDNMYPQIVPDELYKRVRAIVEKNKFGKRSVDVVYMFRHKIRCGYCGRPISADSGTARNGQVVRYYKCLGRKKDKNGCQKSMIRKECLEEVILNAIFDELNKPETLEKIVQGILKVQEKNISINYAVTILKKEKQKAEHALNNLIRALEKGISSNTTQKRLTELEKQKEELEIQIAKEKAKQTVKVTEEEIRAYYDSALRLEPQMLISILVKEIVLYNDRMEIHYNSLIKNGPDESQGFSFYKGSCSMKRKIQNKPKIQKVRIKIEMFIG